MYDGISDGGYVELPDEVLFSGGLEFSDHVYDSRAVPLDAYARRLAEMPHG